MNKELLFKVAHKIHGLPDEYYIALQYPQWIVIFSDSHRFSLAQGNRYRDRLSRGFVSPATVLTELFEITPGEAADLVLQSHRQLVATVSKHSIYGALLHLYHHGTIPEWWYDRYYNKKTPINDPSLSTAQLELMFDKHKNA